MKCKKAENTVVLLCYTVILLLVLKIFICICLYMHKTSLKLFTKVVVYGEENEELYAMDGKEALLYILSYILDYMNALPIQK